MYGFFFFRNYSIIIILVKIRIKKLCILAKGISVCSVHRNFRGGKSTVMYDLSEAKDCC